MKEKELRRELEMNIAQAYQHEDDALYIDEELRSLYHQFQDGEIEYDEYFDKKEALENEKECEEQEAQQLWHVIECDLEELSEMVEYKVSSEEFVK